MQRRPTGTGSDGRNADNVGTAAIAHHRSPNVDADGRHAHSTAGAQHYPAVANGTTKRPPTDWRAATCHIGAHGSE